LTTDSDRYVEMNVGLIRKNNSAADDDWSADSDPDSPPSPADRDNEFTSDTDPDSSTGSDGESSTTDDEESSSP
jgi:hypothetical protein